MATIEELLGKVEVGKSTVFTLSEKLGGGQTLEVVQRAAQPEPPEAKDKQESPRRAHVFHDATSVIDYLERYKTDNTVIIANLSAFAATIVIDESAEEGFETLRIVPHKHPLYEPWESILGRKMPVNQFAEFVLANHRSLVDEEEDAVVMEEVVDELGQTVKRKRRNRGRRVADIFTRIVASEKVTVSRGVGKSSINGLTSEVTISVGDQVQKQKSDIAVPDTLTVRVPLFVGQDAVDLEIDLLLSMSGGEVYVTASAAAVLAVKVDSFQKMMREIDEEVDVVVTFGEWGTVNWEYLE